MSILGRLKDEPPEPMTADEYRALRKRLRDTFVDSIYIDRRELQHLLEEIAWLKKRLQRVEYVIEPLLEDPAEH